jgi:hypothetical protein
MPMMSMISTKVMVMNSGSINCYSDDIAEGVVKYVQLFDVSKRVNQGTGEIELLKIGIKNPLHEKVEYINNSVVLKTFDDLIIEVVLNINPSVADFELFVILFDGQLREVLSSESHSFCKPFSNNSEKIRAFEIKVPRMVLATGSYSITFGAVDPSTKRFYCRIANSLHFTMNSMEVTWATSYVPGEWMEINVAE